jgi:hypothetical protein
MAAAGFSRFLCSAALALAVATAPATAAQLVGEPISVNGALLQIELTPGIVVSAGAGGMLLLTPAPEGGGALAIAVLKGPTLALNMQCEEMRPLGVDTHMLGSNIATHSGASWAAPIDSLPGYDSLSAAQRQGMLIGDRLMVCQQQYLDSLKIDVTAINRIVVSIILSMLPRP